jgi:hypothetical protein
VGCGVGRLGCDPGPAGLRELKEKGRGKWAAAGPGRRAAREGKEKEKKSKVGGLRIRPKVVSEIEIPLDFQILLQICIPI